MEYHIENFIQRHFKQIQLRLLQNVTSSFFYYYFFCVSQPGLLKLPSFHPSDSISISTHGEWAPTSIPRKIEINFLHVSLQFSWSARIVAQICFHFITSCQENTHIFMQSILTYLKIMYVIDDEKKGNIQ